MVGEHEGGGELEVSVNIYLTQAVRKGEGEAEAKVGGTGGFGVCAGGGLATRKPSNASRSHAKKGRGSRPPSQAKLVPPPAGSSGPRSPPAGTSRTAATALLHMTGWRTA